MTAQPIFKLHSTGSVALAALVLLVPLGSSMVQAQFQLRIGSAPAAESTTNHSDRCVAAVDLAILAAESGALDVSIEAVRRACQQGPPVASVDLGGILSPGGPTRSSRISNQENQEGAAQVKLATRLCNLHDVWVEHEVDAAKAYQTWKDLVLPPARPSDAYAYSSGGTLATSISYGNISLDLKPPAVTPCGAANLVHWARAAGKLDDLNAELEKRAELPGAADTVILIRIILASHEDSPVEEGEEQCRALTARPALLIDHPHAELNFGHTWKLIEHLGSDSQPAQDLVDALLKTATSRPRWASNRWLQFMVGWKLNEAIKRGDREAFRMTSQVAMSQFDSMRARNSEYVASREASFYAEASQRAFSAGQAELGIECLKTVALLPNSTRYGGPSLRSLLEAQNPMMKALLKMEPAERLDFLSNIVWRMPMLGLDRYAMLRPTDHVPSLFVPDDSAAQRRLRITRDDGLCYSLLEWAMRESLAQGKEADVEARIKELESRGSDDVKLAQLVWDLTRGERIDFKAFSKVGKDGKPQLVPTMGTERVSLLDLELMRAAIADDQWREAGGKFLEERLPIGVNKAQLTYVAWMRSLRMDLQRALGQPVVTQEALAHWAVSNNPSQYEFLGGHYPTSIWTAQEDGMWNHQCSPSWSYLFLRYPLEGDFAFELQSPDYPWREGAVAIGGLFAEFLRHDGRLLLRPMAERAGCDIKTDAMKLAQLNRYLVETQQGKVKITVGEGDFSSELGEYSSHFPFVTLSCIYYRDASFGKLKLTGEPTIPREVDLLSETLQGWTDYLKHGKLPLLKITPSELVVDPKKAEREIREWHFIDGELRTVDQVAAHAERNAEAKVEAEPFVEKRREAIIQYLRPLCDGEQIDLEFYYEPGKFCLAPTLGRIALLLDEREMGLHWVTFDNELWTGVENTNRAVDPDAEQLAPIELKEKAWNELQLRLEGDTLLVSLNGKPVYRRRWEPEVDRKFGLFHDPTRYHIRVRNVRLSGDWPEKLPADFFELRSGSKI